ncbi:MAG: PAS domain S-box protein [Sphingobacteriales bacterium]|nr:MAG: PAS domain S-box protein [Sphingobacteriales bacterium]
MIRWKYIWPYIMVIFTIVVIVYINAEWTSKQNLAHNRIAITINEAGRQRALSQKLVTASLLARQGEKLPTFEDDLVLWNSTHEKLMNENERFNNALVHDAAVRKTLTGLDGVQKKLFSQLAAVLLEDAEGATIDSIKELQGDYLPAMDRAVQQMQLRTELLITADNRRSIWRLVLSGLFLICEILVIIIPYHRRLLVAFRKLKEQQQQIVQQSEKIAYQNDKLAQQNVELDKMHSNEMLTLTGINAGIWSWDIKSGQEEWSPKFFDLLGYEPDQIMANFNTYINVLVHPDDVDTVKKRLDGHLKRDEPYNMNVRMRLKNGKYRWFETAGQASKDEYGKAVRMAGSIIDVHEKVLYQQQLEGMNQTKDKLFAIVAHDLRSPIAGIRSLLDLAGEGRITQQEFAEYIEKAKENISFVSETLDNILQWALSQMQGLERKPDKVDLRKTIHSLINLYSNNMDEKRISAEVSITGNHLVYADQNQVFMALRNVLSNAIKFTPDGGKINISVASKGGVEMISIADNGVGISEKDIKAILRDKQHVSHIGTNGEKGTGLGLPLTVATVKENNGTIDIESSKGEGTMVTISLPRLFT